MKTVALGKVAKIDRTVATDDECLALPYVGLEHVEKESGRFAEGFVPTPLNMLATNFRFTPKHVLYGKLRPYLNKVVLPSFDGVCTTEILPILPNEEKLDRTFLWAILLSPTFVNWATSQISGANLPRLDPKLLAEYEIPLPPLTEQKRIASLLARADRLRHLRRTAHELGESLLQSVFLEMFGDPIKNNPNGYEICELKEVCTRITDGTHQPPEWAESGIPFLFVSNVVDGELTFDTQKFISEKTWYELQKRCPIELNDILYTIVGSYGNAALVKTTRKFSFQRHIAHVKPNPKKILPVFLLGMMQSIMFREQVEQQVRGVAQKTLNLGELQEIKIFVPPLNLQEEFAGVVARVESLRGRMSEGERQVEGLFESLLNQSFSS